MATEEEQYAQMRKYYGLKEDATIDEIDQAILTSLRKIRSQCPLMPGDKEAQTYYHYDSEGKWVLDECPFCGAHVNQMAEQILSTYKKHYNCQKCKNSLMRWITNYGR